MIALAHLRLANTGVLSSDLVAMASARLFSLLRSPKQADAARLMVWRSAGDNATPPGSCPTAGVARGVSR
jgi:hypothetical protein